jgi:hypothetical protein
MFQQNFPQLKSVRRYLTVLRRAALSVRPRKGAGQSLVGGNLCLAKIHNNKPKKIQFFFGIVSWMGAFFYEKESTQHVRVGSTAVQKIYRLIIISSVQAARIPKNISPKIVFFRLLFLAVGTWVGWWWWICFFYKKASTQNEMFRWALDGCSRDRLID